MLDTDSLSEITGSIFRKVEQPRINDLARKFIFDQIKITGQKKGETVDGESWEVATEKFKTLISPADGRIVILAPTGLEHPWYGEFEVEEDGKPKGKALLILLPAEFFLRKRNMENEEFARMLETMISYQAEEEDANRLRSVDFDPPRRYAFSGIENKAHVINTLQATLGRPPTTDELKYVGYNAIIVKDIHVKHSRESKNSPPFDQVPEHPRAQNTTLRHRTTTNEYAHITDDRGADIYEAKRIGDTAVFLGENPMILVSTHSGFMEIPIPAEVATKIDNHVKTIDKAVDIALKRKSTDEANKTLKGRTPKIIAECFNIVDFGINNCWTNEQIKNELLSTIQQQKENEER